MSWSFSRAQVVEYWEANCSDTEQYAQLNTTDMPQVYSCSDKMMAFYRRSRSGMKCELLEGSRGEALLTAYLAGFHAKTSAAQEKERESKEKNQDCGQKCSELLAKYDHHSCSCKTQIGLFPEDLVEFSETWPLSGTIRNGCAYELPSVERTMSGRVYGFLPTPTAHNSKEGAYPAEYTRKTPTLATHAGGKINPEWTEWLMHWPIGWTDLKPLGMVRFQSWRRLHFKS